jgi:hypothetical protein
MELSINSFLHHNHRYIIHLIENPLNTNTHHILTLIDNILEKNINYMK